MPAFFRKAAGEGGLIVLGAVLLAGAAILRSGDVWYASLLKFCGGSHALAAYSLLGGAPLFVFIAVGGAFCALDMSSSPLAAQIKARYKLQPYFKPNWNDYLDVIKRAMINMLLIGVVWTGTLCWIVLPRRYGNEAGAPPPLPSLGTLGWQIACILFFQELLFYYGHRLAHVPSLYGDKWLNHKLHHQWKAPFAWAAVYASPGEHLLCNLLPIATGPVVGGVHPMLFSLWLCLGLTNTLCVHSGYAIPGLPSPYSHDLHHLDFDTEYGVLGILDALHGTDSMLGPATEARKAAGTVGWAHGKAALQLKRMKEAQQDGKLEGNAAAAGKTVKTEKDE